VAKADSLLAILWLLRSRGKMTAPALAETLEISVRTVYRYIDALAASGVPIIAETGPDGGYSLPPEFRSTPLFFEPAELVALFGAARFAQAGGYPYADALMTALAKVERNLTPVQQAELARHQTVLGVAAADRGGPVAPWLADLESAAAAGATVEMTYQKPGATVAENRQVDPYLVFHRAGYWYLVGYCHLRGDLREFRVDRIQALRRTGGTFARPEGFRAEEYLGDDWIAADLAAGPLTEVHLAGDPLSIGSLCEHWYLKHCLVRREERAAWFRVPPGGMANLPGHVLSYGTSVTVVAPASLRQAVIERAREWLAHHEQSY
jgi:predicted DNA-binding transcriptional regulator YafY